MQKPESKNQPLLNVQEVAERLNVAETTIYKLVNKRRLPHTKIGGALRFDPAMLEKWIRERTVMPMPVS